jgi:hypothetical protein
VRLLRDDGGIVYLNGTEVFRSAITNPVVTSASYTPPAVSDDGTIYQMTNASPSLLVNGPNEIAVEIHQDATNSSDISFDLMLWAQVAGGPKLTITPTGSTDVDVSWPFPSTGFVLESKNALGPTTSWLPAPDADVPSGGSHHVAVHTASGNRFFRLRQP